MTVLEGFDPRGWASEGPAARKFKAAQLGVSIPNGEWLNQYQGDVKGPFSALCPSRLLFGGFAVSHSAIPIATLAGVSCCYGARLAGWCRPSPSSCQIQTRVCPTTDGTQSAMHVLVNNF
jgi:hypothetical protein